MFRARIPQRCLLFIHNAIKMFKKTKAMLYQIYFTSKIKKKNSHLKIKLLKIIESMQGSKLSNTTQAALDLDLGRPNL
jgi:hypothetical protein